MPITRAKNTGDLKNARDDFQFEAGLDVDEPAADLEILKKLLEGSDPDDVALPDQARRSPRIPIPLIRSSPL